MMLFEDVVSLFSRFLDVSQTGFFLIMTCLRIPCNSLSYYTMNPAEKEDCLAGLLSTKTLKMEKAV